MEYLTYIFIMNIGYALLISLFAGLSTLIGALFIFIPISESKRNKFITFCLAFSIIIMIGISITDLLPSSIMVLQNIYHNKIFIIIPSLFLIGYIIVKLVTMFLKKVDNDLYKLGILSMITLILHNLPEGIITFLSSYINPMLGLKLSIAIALHNIPEGIAIAVPLYYATGSKAKAIGQTALSGLSEPLGALIAYLFLARFITNNIIALILVIVASLMITLAIEHMLPETIKYKEKKFIWLGFSIGIIIIVLNVMLG